MFKQNGNLVTIGKRQILSAKYLDIGKYVQHLCRDCAIQCKMASVNNS